jgi:hypothetical protein
MCPGGATCLPVDYCLSEVALLKNLTKLVGLVHALPCNAKNLNMLCTLRDRRRFIHEKVQ